MINKKLILLFLKPKGNPINVLEFEFENHDLSIEKLKGNY